MPPKICGRVNRFIRISFLRMRLQSLFYSLFSLRWRSLFLCLSKSLPTRPMPVTTRARSGISCFCSNFSNILRVPLRWLALLSFLPLGLFYSCSFPFWIRRSGLPCWKRPVALTVTCLSVVLIVLLTILGAIAPRLELASEQPPAAEQTEPSQDETQEEKSEEDTAVFDFGLD